MADNNNQNGQDSTQQLINIFKSVQMAYYWISSILNYSYIIPNSWILENNFNYCLVFSGIGIGYMKDRTQDFMNFLNRWS